MPESWEDDMNCSSSITGQIKPPVEPVVWIHLHGYKVAYSNMAYSPHHAVIAAGIDV